MANQESNDDEEERSPSPPVRTDTEEAVYGSSNAVRSTTQSIDTYTPDNRYLIRGVDSAVIAETGAIFQSPVSTPSHNTPMHSPSPGRSNRVVDFRQGSSNEVRSNIRNNASSSRRNRGVKRRRSDLEDTRNGQRYPRRRYAGQVDHRTMHGPGSESGSGSENINRDNPDTADGDSISLTSQASLTGTDDDTTDSSSDDGAFRDDMSDLDDEDTVETEGPSTPRGQQ